MKKICRITFLYSIMLLTSAYSYAQSDKVRDSQKSSVTQYFGLDTRITIDYSRPAVKDRVIWGNIVPYGLGTSERYGNGNPFPWRAGANENTTIEINNDVQVEGIYLPAGKYSIHMIPSETDWIIIFNKNNSQWGSYSYDQSADVIRVPVTPVKSYFKEFLTFGFGNITSNSVTAFLHWEKLKIPFLIGL